MTYNKTVTHTEEKEKAVETAFEKSQILHLFEKYFKEAIGNMFK